MGTGRILCIHSSGLSGAQWARLAGALSPDFEVFAPDLLGYGECREPVVEPFAYSQDLERLLAMLDGSTILIGHSYGGFLALQMALRAPKKVRAVIAFDPIAWGALRSTRPEALEPLKELRFAQPGASQDEWLRSFVDFWGEAGSWDRMSSRAQESMIASYPKMRQEVASLVFDETPDTVYGRLSLPVLLVSGKQSPLVQQWVTMALHEAIAGSQLQEMDGGHMAPITRGEEFLQLVRVFLDRLPT